MYYHYFFTQGGRSLRRTFPKRPVTHSCSLLRVPLSTSTVPSFFRSKRQIQHALFPWLCELWDQDCSLNRFCFVEVFCSILSKDAWTFLCPCVDALVSSYQPFTNLRSDAFASFSIYGLRLNWVCNSVIRFFDGLPQFLRLIHAIYLRSWDIEPVFRNDCKDPYISGDPFQNYGGSCRN